MKIGLSRFTLGFLGGDLLGIFLGNLISFQYYYFLIVVAVLIFLAVRFNRHRIILLIIISGIGLCLGLANFRYFDAKEQAKKITYGQDTNIGVTVESSIIKNNFQQIIVKYQNTKILIQTNLYPAYQYGDVLKVTGQIQDPAGIKIQDFDYGKYLYKKQIRGLIKNPEKIGMVGNSGNKIIAGILKIGDRFQLVLNQVLPEPMSTLMVGLIIGLKQQLPDSVATAFVRTGLSHLTAVSGYNVTIVIVWISFLLTYISRRVALPGTIAATIVFVILSGAGASVLRAGILAILILLAKYIGRKVYYPILILLVADVMLMFNPYALKNDISFQLSFLTFVGLLLLSSPIAAHRSLEIIPENIRKVLAETLGAQILVLPILIYNFGIISLVAPLTNILILPLIPAAMLIGFITGIAGLIYLKLGYLLANFAWLILKYILIVVEGFSRLNFAALTFKSADWFWIPLYYVLIIIWLRYSKQKPQTPAGQSPLGDALKS